MYRLIVLGLFFCCLVSSVSAGMLAQDPLKHTLSIDWPQLYHSEYCTGSSYSRFPKPETKLEACPSLRQDPLDIIYSRSYARRYIVQPNDTLSRIARIHGTTIELIRALNRLTDDRLQIDQILWVWDRPFTIEIDKTFNRVYLKLGDVVLNDYPVSTGKSEKQTPMGVYFIHSRYPFPTWFHKGVVVSAGSPQNYLGSRWLGFDKPQFGMHGTIFPWLLGKSVSSGCVRMKNEDVEEIYEFIPVGTLVIIKETP